MLKEFVAGFLGTAPSGAPGAEEWEVYRVAIPTRAAVVMRRPNRKKMKRCLLDALKESRTQYRFRLTVSGKEYHAIRAYARSAVYTLVYEYIGKKRKFPKLVSFHNGCDSPRQIEEYIRYAVEERQMRIARSFTMGRYDGVMVATRRRSCSKPSARGSFKVFKPWQLGSNTSSHRGVDLTRLLQRRARREMLERFTQIGKGSAKLSEKLPSSTSTGGSFSSKSVEDCTN